MTTQSRTLTDQDKTATTRHNPQSANINPGSHPDLCQDGTSDLTHVCTYPPLGALMVASRPRQVLSFKLINRSVLKTARKGKQRVSMSQACEDGVRQQNQTKEWIPSCTGYPDTACCRISLTDIRLYWHLRWSPKNKNGRPKVRSPKKRQERASYTAVRTRT
jgi:hypothetical protein